MLGPPVQAERGVEIELGYAFDGRRALIGKSLGFPLISIDITKMTLAELTPEWAQRVLTEQPRVAMNKDVGKGVSLVPWKPVIEQRLGQQIAATVRGGWASWEIGKQRGISRG